MLYDTHQRIHNYLRISITDHCNFRCQYCMPEENMRFLPAAHHMTVEEIFSLARCFVSLGVNKIRLTGGEPTLRSDFSSILQALATLPVQLTLTTNAFLTDRYISDLKAAGIRSLNVSLDTLQADRFKEMTRRDVFYKVKENIDRLIQEQFHVKLNMVVMRGVNHDEIPAFIEWTRSQPVHIRFIEFMPFAGNHWNSEGVFIFQEIMDLISAQYSIIKLNDEAHATTKKYQVKDHAGTFAFISTMSAPFCSTCNRIRLTADGKIKNCLFSTTETDLLTPYREGQDIIPLIEQSIRQKKKALGGQWHEDFHEIKQDTLINREMIRIGG
ncbi:MAG TPA: GTP 3',8-cyclase MoaA [Chitinophagaceae bacterium]|nr:GTP 3',8-cyclase MoaA [Chitinophagaceae bacterium]HNF70939.1 GTP 3',8-cyclase MoaA [Chitinophagaceae bacterium]